MGVVGNIRLQRLRAVEDPAIVAALARAHRWKRLLEDGRYTSISEMAALRLARWLPPSGSTGAT